MDFIKIGTKIECAVGTPTRPRVIRWTDHFDSLGATKVGAIVQNDFQLHNLRVDPETLNQVAVLDFGKAKIAPAFTVPTPEIFILVYSSRHQKYLDVSGELLEC